MVDGERENDKGTTITLFWLCGQLWGIFESTRAALSPVSDVKTGRKGHPRRVYLFRTCHPRREITPISRIATNGLTTIGRFKITPNSMRIPRVKCRVIHPRDAEEKPLGILLSSLRITQRSQIIQNLWHEQDESSKGWDLILAMVRRFEGFERFFKFASDAKE